MVKGLFFYHRVRNESDNLAVIGVLVPLSVVKDVLRTDDWRIQPEHLTPGCTKYLHAIFGHPRFLLRGLEGTRAEISLAVMAYNFKRMLKLMGGAALRTALATR